MEQQPSSGSPQSTLRLKAGSLDRRQTREVRELISLYRGNAAGELIRDSDPEGNAVEHIVVRRAAPIDRMVQSRAIDEEMHQAGQRFHFDFERAQLVGRYGTVHIDGVSARGKSEMSDMVVAARERITRALEALGHRPELARISLSAQVCWWILGEEITIAGFVHRCRGGGKEMNEGKASGILIGALESLALHYGLIDSRKMKSREYQRGMRAGLAHAADRAQVEAAAISCRTENKERASEAFKRFAEELRAARTDREAA